MDFCIAAKKNEISLSLYIFMETCPEYVKRNSSNTVYVVFQLYKNICMYSCMYCNSFGRMYIQGRTNFFWESRMGVASEGRRVL